MSEFIDDRLTQAADWIEQLHDEAGVPYKSIARMAGIPYTTLLYVKNRSGSDITSSVYQAIQKVFNERFPAKRDASGPSIPQSVVGFKIADDDAGEKQIQITAPESAREFYERFEFHGGKVDWLELDEDARSFYENLHSLLLRSIDSVNERYAAGMRELRAVRERELRAALEEFEKTFHKRMLGLLGN